ncbi:hypothetical protein A3A21_00315 [Candidatus Jorgensenbacteria bacterium RIFCSPLOWO2_01_FULL_45_25b]|uniref:DUF5671 domain-containing protein n=1 Tax=Candidatus Jorgensenbacteria bacterium RIFCSPLOWO2_01_FULL_45_25b TaxID=1798471 RepID=A0A1F6BS20_9BACT|nr:MAG: hypothetical protein A3A21_00315 [Candidatus Jorgensenbacteria bacterium RIFCSPLOWO2_01_FULL_45_25b]
MNWRAILIALAISYLLTGVGATLQLRKKDIPWTKETLVSIIVTFLWPYFLLERWLLKWEEKTRIP